MLLLQQSLVVVEVGVFNLFEEVPLVGLNSLAELPHGDVESLEFAVLVQDDGELLLHFSASLLVFEELSFGIDANLSNLVPV